MQHQGQYRGVAYTVEALSAAGGGYEGRYRLNEASPDASPGGAAKTEGAVDQVHPPTDPTWSTENEALTYATEAACHAIESLQFGRPQAQGHGSASTDRRTNTLGQ